MESGQHSTSPESIHEEDRFKDLPEFTFIKAVTNPQSGLYVSTLPQKEHPSLYEEENPNRGFTIGYKITF